MANIENHVTLRSFNLTCMRVCHNEGESSAVGPANRSFEHVVILQQVPNTAQARPWLRFMLLGLVAFVWLGRTSDARASCGYYVIIGHPTSQAAAEQATLSREQMPMEHGKCPCQGPQCRRQDRPMTPVQGGSISVQEPMVLSAHGTASESDFSIALIGECSFLSDPHIWQIDPPPRV